ncbi:MAG TPA: DUF1775 domain-containing protein [Gemmatimonadales bacterium]
MILTASALAAAPGLARAQIAIAPSGIEPTAWERIAIRVVNQSASAVVSVRVDVPDAIGVLGVDQPEGWTITITSPSDTAPQAIEWTGGRLDRGAFREFAFLGRLAGNVKQRTLVFPVRITREDGTTVSWSRGGEGTAPTMAIRGSTTISSWGAFALAGVAFGVALVAAALAMRRRTDI